MRWNLQVIQKLELQSPSVLLALGRLWSYFQQLCAHVPIRNGLSLAYPLATAALTLQTLFQMSFKGFDREAAAVDSSG
jgi:hypothetical protein